MKRSTVIILAMCLCTASLHAQTSASVTGTNSKFVVAMEKNIQMLDTASTPDAYISLANTFDRIGNAESSQWQPFYYAAYCYTILAYMTPDKTKVDGIADRADGFLKKADALSNNNSEISTLSAMLTYCRLQVDPINRWQNMGPEAESYLAKAKEQNPANPRPYLIEARAKLYTPENMGGGPKAAASVISIAMEKFNAFVPANSIAAHWGKPVAEKMYAQVNGRQ